MTSSHSVGTDRDCNLIIAEGEEYVNTDDSSISVIVNSSRLKGCTDPLKTGRLAHSISVVSGFGSKLRQLC